VPRRIPPERLTDIGRAACAVFTAKGYRLSLISDVADLLGLSHGLIYRYVDSKEALFGLALRFAMDPSSLADLELPVSSPEPGETISSTADWLKEKSRLPILNRARKIKRADDERAEFASVIAEHYDTVASNHPVLALIERCAPDLPDLHIAYFLQMRRTVQGQSAEYIGSRIEAGQFRPVLDITVATRFVIETVAWFAWHREGDPDSETIGNDVARTTVIQLLVNAFCWD